MPPPYSQSPAQLGSVPAQTAGLYQYPSPSSSAPDSSLDSPVPAYTPRTTFPALNLNYLTPQPSSRSNDYPEVLPGHSQMVQSAPLPDRNNAFSTLSIQSPRQDVSHASLLLLCSALFSFPLYSLPFLCTVLFSAALFFLFSCSLTRI